MDNLAFHKVYPWFCTAWTESILRTYRSRSTGSRITCRISGLVTNSGNNHFVSNSKLTLSVTTLLFMLSSAFIESWNRRSKCSRFWLDDIPVPRSSITLLSDPCNIGQQANSGHGAENWMLIESCLCASNYVADLTAFFLLCLSDFLISLSWYAINKINVARYVSSSKQHHVTVYNMSFEKIAEKFLNVFFLISYRSCLTTHFEIYIKMYDME